MALENYYFEGIYEGNLDLLNQVYNTGTLLFGDVKGQPYGKTLDQYLDGVKNRLSPNEIKVKMYDFNYHEFLSFHKLNGRWLIVNKMISDVNE
jgi:hypothetical protein